MKIGMVTACYKPVINGVTRMVSLYKQELEALGHEVYVFTLGDPDPAGDEPRVIRSPAIPVGEGYYVTMRYTHAAQDLLRKMDILHCHHLFMSVDMAHRYANCPIVYTNHTRYDLYTGAYMPLPQPAADAVMRQIWPEFTDLADVVITPSESVREIMLTFGVRQPIVVIENGVNIRPFRHPAAPYTKSDFGIPESSPLFLYLGRLSPEKNLELLLRQFTIAHDIIPEIRLMIIGQGPLHEALPGIAQDLGVADLVHFGGPVPYERVPDILACADVFVTASISEVHPLTIIEAMAAGLPVAATESPGIRDTIEAGINGLLTSHPDGGLAAAMAGLAISEQRRKEMGQMAADASARFDIKRTVDRTVVLYEKLMFERPDLHRKREHGRWVKNRDLLQPLLDQLTQIVRPPEKAGTGPLNLRRLFNPGDLGNDQKDEW